MGEQRDHIKHWAFDVADGFDGLLPNPHSEIPV